MALWRTCQDLLQMAGDRQPKMVVHCAGGIGRTGVFIAVDMCARVWVQFKKMISPDKMIGYLRERRVNMVQTETQYAFLHYSVGPVAKHLQSGLSPGISTGLPSAVGLNDDTLSRHQSVF